MNTLAGFTASKAPNGGPLMRLVVGAVSLLKGIQKFLDAEALGIGIYTRSLSPRRRSGERGKEEGNLLKNKPPLPGSLLLPASGGEGEMLPETKHLLTGLDTNGAWCGRVVNGRMAREKQS